MSSARLGLLLIDLQESFCAPTGTMALQGREYESCARAAEHCKNLAHIAHEAAVPVFWTRFVLHPTYANGGRLTSDYRPGLVKLGALRQGTADAKLLEDLPILEQDVVLDKPRFSAFYACSLEAALRAKDIDQLIVGGVTTSMCVESTVRDASQRDYGVTVVREATADFDDQRHEASLRAIEFGFGSVVDMTQAASLLTAASTPMEKRSTTLDIHN